MLDKSVPYFDFYMERLGNREIPEYHLPENYTFTTYAPGDVSAWAEIETSVQEFDTPEAAQSYFQKTFLPHSQLLPEAMFFIENSDGRKIATATAWFEIVETHKIPLIHWVAIHPDYQGKGLANALITKIMQRMVLLYGEQNFYLHTQTWSHKAVKLYQKFHFNITKEPVVLNESNINATSAITVLRGLGYDLSL